MPPSVPPLVREGHKNLALRIKKKLKVAVKTSLDAGVKDVIVVGRSQGGSVAEILGMAYEYEFPSDVRITVRAFNPPRTGDLDWARLVDSAFDGRFGYAVCKNDGTARSPSFKYNHPMGEIFLPVGADEGAWVACKGRENPECSFGVPVQNLKSASDGDPWVYERGLHRNTDRQSHGGPSGESCSAAEETRPPRARSSPTFKPGSTRNTRSHARLVDGLSSSCFRIPRGDYPCCHRINLGYATVELSGTGSLISPQFHIARSMLTM
jgi:hypothetical protein